MKRSYLQQSEMENGHGESLKLTTTQSHQMGLHHRNLWQATADPLSKNFPQSRSPTLGIMFYGLGSRIN